MPSPRKSATPARCEGWPCPVTYGPQNRIRMARQNAGSISNNHSKGANNVNYPRKRGQRFWSIAKRAPMWWFGNSKNTSNYCWRNYFNFAVFQLGSQVTLYCYSIRYLSAQDFFCAVAQLSIPIMKVWIPQLIVEFPSGSLFHCENWKPWPI